MANPEVSEHIAENKMSPKVIQALFDRAYFSSSIDDDDDVLVETEAISVYISINKDNRLLKLRLQTGNRRLRVFYAFDPRRLAILLIGGNKTGNDRFYEVFVPRADRIYDQYLREIRQEGLIT